MVVIFFYTLLSTFPTNWDWSDAMYRPKVMSPPCAASVWKEMHRMLPAFWMSRGIRKEPPAAISTVVMWPNSAIKFLKDIGLSM